MFRNLGRASRLTLAVGALAATALVLSGCAGGPAEQTGSATEGTLDWWGFSPNDTTANLLIDAFNEEYPDITVNYKFYPNNGDYPAALRAGLASSSGPDLYNLSTNSAAPVDQFGPFAVDLAPMYEETLGEDWEDTVSQLARDSFTLDNGSLAGAALGFVTAGQLFINNDLFEKYDLTPPSTLDEWNEVCDTFEANGVQCFAIGAGTGPGFNVETLHSIANSVAPGKWQETASGDGSWTDPWFVETLEAWKALQDDGIIAPGALGLQQYPDANNMFLQQKAAMVQMGTWYNANMSVENMTAAIEAAGVADAQPFTLLSIPFPDLTNEGNVGLRFSDVDSALAINAKSDSIAAAQTFVAWLTTSQAGQQQIANRLELTPDTGQTPDFSQVNLVNPELQQANLEELFANSAENTREARFRLLPPALIEALVGASTAVLEGTSTPEEAAAAVQAVADEQ